MPNGSEQPDGYAYRNLLFTKLHDERQSSKSAPERFAEEEVDPIGHFVQSAFYAGIQSPIDGVRELTNKLVNRELLPEISLVSRPDNVHRWTNIVAQKVGAAVGTIPMFIALNKCVSGAGISMGLISESTAMTLAGRTALAGASGFIYGGVFQSNLANQDSSHGFWRGRLDNAVTNAATFATMSYVHGRYAQAWLPSDRLLFEAPLKADLIRNVKIGAISGTIGGAVHAEVGSIIGGTGLASPRQLMRSVTDFAIMGAGFGAVNGVVENRSFNASVRQRMEASKLSDFSIENGRAGKLESRLSQIGNEQEFPLASEFPNGTERTADWVLGRDAEGRAYLSGFGGKDPTVTISGKKIAMPSGRRLFVAPGDSVQLPVYGNDHWGWIEPLSVNVSSVPLSFKMGTSQFQLNVGETKPLADMIHEPKLDGLTNKVVIGRDRTGHFVRNLEADPMNFDFLTLDHKPIPTGQKTYVNPFSKIGVWHNSNSEMLDIHAQK